MHSVQVGNVIYNYYLTRPLSPTITDAPSDCFAAAIERGYQPFLASSLRRFGSTEDGGTVWVSFRMTDRPTEYGAPLPGQPPPPPALTPFTLLETPMRQPQARAPIPQHRSIPNNDVSRQQRDQQIRGELTRSSTDSPSNDESNDGLSQPMRKTRAPTPFPAKTPKARRPFMPAPVSSPTSALATNVEDGDSGVSSSGPSSTGPGPSNFDLGTGGWSEIKGYDLPVPAKNRGIGLPGGSLLTTLKVSFGSNPTQPSAKSKAGSSGSAEADDFPDQRAVVAAAYGKYQADESNASFVDARLMSVATLTPTMWQYMSAETRTEEIENALEVTKGHECPPALQWSIKTSVAQLLALEAVEVELDEGDQDVTEFIEGSDIVKLMKTTNDILVDLTLSGVTHYIHRHRQLLRDVQTILSARIPFEQKVHTAAHAAIIWPNYDFTTDSEALNGFLAAHDAHLASLSDVAVDQDGEDDGAPLSTLPNLEGYTPHIYDHKTALTVLNTPHRQVAPAIDDVKFVEDNLIYFKNRILEALISVPHDLDDFQKKQWQTWLEYYEGGKYNHEKLDATSYEIWHEALRLHREGCILYGLDDWCLKHLGDQNLMCSERLEVIIKALLAHKYVAKDCLNRQFLLRLIAAPNEVLRTKLTTGKNTATRAGTHKRKRVKSATPMQTEDGEDDEQQEWTVLSQKKGRKRKVASSKTPMSHQKKKWSVGQTADESMVESPVKKTRGRKKLNPSVEIPQESGDEESAHGDMLTQQIGDAATASSSRAQARPKRKGRASTCSTNAAKDSQTTGSKAGLNDD